MVLQEDKSPFMLAIPPQCTKQSLQHRAELDGRHSPRAPHPPGSTSHPMCPRALARGVPHGPDSEHPLTHSISTASHQGHHGCSLALALWVLPGQGDSTGVAATATAHGLHEGDRCPTGEHPQTSWHHSAHQADNSPPPAAGSPPRWTKGQTRGMDGSPQPRAQPQPLWVTATVSGLAQGPWQGPGKARASAAAQGWDAKCGKPGSPLTHGHKCFSRG